MVTFTNEVVNAVSSGVVPVAFPKLYKFHPDLPAPAFGGTGCSECEGKGCVGCVNANGAVQIPDDAPTNDLSDLIHATFAGTAENPVQIVGASESFKHCLHFGTVSGLVCGYAARQMGWYPFLVVYKGESNHWLNYVFFLEFGETFESVFQEIIDTFNTILVNMEDITVKYVSREVDDDGNPITTEIQPEHTPAELNIFSIEKFNELTIEHDDWDVLNEKKKKAEKERKDEEEREKKRQLSLETLQTRKKQRGSPDKGAKKSRKKEQGSSGKGAKKP